MCCGSGSGCSCASAERQLRVGRIVPGVVTTAPAADGFHLTREVPHSFGQGFASLFERTIPVDPPLGSVGAEMEQTLWVPGELDEHSVSQVLVVIRMDERTDRKLFGPPRDQIGSRL